MVTRRNPLETICRNLLAAWSRHRQAQAQRRQFATILARKNDHLLDDIGLSRNDAQEMARRYSPFCGGAPPRGRSMKGNGRSSR